MVDVLFGEIEVERHDKHVHTFLLSADIRRKIFADLPEHCISYVCLHFEHLRKSLSSMLLLHLVHAKAIPIAVISKRSILATVARTALERV